VEASLHHQFKDVAFSNEVIDMFAHILKEDRASIEILRFIAAQQKVNEKVSILHISENVKVERKVGVKHKGEKMYFETKVTNIDRKAAERTVNMLATMSLLYSENLKPYKFFYLTIRGVLVLKRIQTINQVEGSNNQ